jgi:ppGpp synthetase/RelA/SpoT-type nucleotidyltranferase
LAARPAAVAEGARVTEEQRSALADHVDAFQTVRPQYVALSDAVSTALRSAICAEYPNALIASRVKSLGGFAEKVARRGYADPLRQMTDLCGVRVVLQTTAEVAAVGAFLEANLEVHERDDKLDRLELDEFGYRDLHVLAAIPADPAGRLWRDHPAAADLAGLPFELQVRTWLQHAWAELVHDRLYKSELAPNRHERRRIHALAALLEEGDRIADDVARSVDSRKASYTQWATRAAVLEEIETRRTLLQAGAGGGAAREVVALAPMQREVVALARMQRAVGDLDGAIDTLQAHGGTSPVTMSELGHCLCVRSWDRPDSDEFAEGRRMLEVVPPPSGLAARETSDQARRLSRLAWSVSRNPGPGGPVEAARVMQQALDLDPDNPYLLSDALTLDHAAGLRDRLGEFTARDARRAVAACTQHAAAGLELPRANFVAARLSLLLGDRLAALSHYARGLTRVADNEVCHGVRTLPWELHWLDLLADWPGLRADLDWVRELLARVQASEEFVPVVLRGWESSRVGEVADLRELPRLPDFDEQPSPQAIRDAIRHFRQIAGGGPNVVFLDARGGDPVYSRVALGLGAKVAVSGPAGAGSVLSDPAWEGTVATLMPIPDDPSTIEGMLTDPHSVTALAPMRTGADEPGHRQVLDLTAMARVIHARYLETHLSGGKAAADPPRCAWDRLPATYVDANVAQAAGIIRILR